MAEVFSFVFNATSVIVGVPIQHSGGLMFGN